MAGAAPARADTVTDWNTHATNALVVMAGQGPTVSAVHLQWCKAPFTTP